MCYTPSKSVNVFVDSNNFCCNHSKIMSVSLSPSLFVKIPQFSSNELGMWGDLERLHNFFICLLCFFLSFFLSCHVWKVGTIEEAALNLLIGSSSQTQHKGIFATLQNSSRVRKYTNWWHLAAKCVSYPMEGVSIDDILMFYK